MIEKKVLIHNKISGILSISDHNISQYSKAVVLLHGFASDKNESECKEAYKVLAKTLLKKNIISLRIDFSGWGENISLTQENSTIDTMISDAITAFKYLQETLRNTEVQIGYIGFSLGAAISILSARKLDGDCKFLGLLSPVGDLPKDFEDFLGKSDYSRWVKSKSNSEVVLPWRTVNLGKNFADSLYNHKVRKDILKLCIPILGIAGLNDFSAKHAKYFIENSNHHKSHLILYNNTDHCLNAFSKNIKLFDAINFVSEWISKLN